MKRVYLDNCCFNRPFDDQSQFKIKIESEAKLLIQEKIKNGEIELIWSFILDYENKNNIDKRKQKEISIFEKYSKEYFIGTNKTLEIAKNFVTLGLKNKDALHLASAVESQCEYFITTDKGIIKKNNIISEITIINPIDFIIKLGESS